MLREFRIEGLGVIEDAHLDLADGLTVLTGETGAGKTMVVTGLALLFGGRADPSRVRGGFSRLLVEGRLALPADHPVWDIARGAGGEPDEDGTLILARTVSSEGRSRAYLGGRSVPVSVLSDVAERVWALHGQSDQQRLRSPREQRAALDRFAGPEHAALLDGYRNAHRSWRELDQRLEARTARRHELARTADVLRHGLAEIAAVDPQPGEDRELGLLAARLADADALRAAAEEAHAILAGDPMADPSSTESDVHSGLSRAASSLQRAGDDALRQLGSKVAELSYTVADIGTELAAYIQDAVADPGRLAVVQERLSAIQTLVRRFAAPGAGGDGVLAWARDADQQLLDLDVSDEALQSLHADRDAARDTVDELAAAISASRAKAATTFSEAVAGELVALAMPDARIEVEITTDPAAPRPDGTDDVVLLLAPHVGSQPLPVHRGASGGELSRVMLAIEVVLAGTDPVPLLVFDEVDAGVGGAAAVQIGRRLGALAAHHQVLVVTHLPQVAAYGDAHLVVDKSSDGTVTASGVHLVDDAARVRELSRMLAGLPGSETGLAHAAELLASASERG